MKKDKEHICPKCEHEWPWTKGACAIYMHGLHRVFECVGFTPKTQEPEEKKATS